MKLIPLSQQGKLKGKYFTQVDDDVYDWAMQWRWFILKSAKRKYAVRWDGKTIILLHRAIMNTPKGMVVDHINHDTLNCQKYNLRNCTSAENSMNRTAKNTGASQYLGVYKQITINKYKGKIYSPITRFCVSLMHNKKYIYIGAFKEEIEAAKAYNMAAIKYHGEFANLNKIT